MNEILKHLGVFFGIISFFSGIAVLTVNLVFCEVKENRYYQILRRYHIAFFMYILTIFAYYYVEQFIVDEREFAVLNVIGNLTLACLCISHAEIITFLNGSGNSRRYRFLVMGNVLYVLGWIVINIFWVNSEGYVDVQPGISVVWGIEGILFASLAYFAIGEYRLHQKKDKWCGFFLGVFVIEYIWEVMYDLAIAEPFFLFTNIVSPFNIIFVIYIVVNVILLGGLYRKILKRKIKDVELEKTEQEIHQEEQVGKQAEKYGLTAREYEIVQLLLDRKSNQEIADQLFISNNTVKHHVSNIFKKTGVSRRTELQQLFQEEKR